MMRYIKLIQMCVKCKIELILILRINFCIRSTFILHHCEPSFIVDLSFEKLLCNNFKLYYCVYVCECLNPVCVLFMI